MNYFSHKLLKLFVHQLVPITLIISLIVIFIVLIAEFYFSLLPCELCVYQRIPYIAVIVFAVFWYPPEMVQRRLGGPQQSSHEDLLFVVFG